MSSGGVLDLTVPLSGPVVLDVVQAAASAHRGAGLVLGAPGTGKTTVVVRWAAARADAPPLVVVPTRQAARRVTDLLGEVVGGTTGAALVRTPHSLAWAVLREHSARSGLPAPRLVTGGEADVMVADLLAGQAASDEGAWPAGVPAEGRGTRAFRADLRELWSRAVEGGLGPRGLARLGAQRDRPEWVAAAGLLGQRLDIAGLRGDNAWDPSEIVAEAAALLESDDSLRVWVHERGRALAVDDGHDLTPAAWRLVRAAAVPGGDLLVTGDPDAATQAFRGGRPTALLDSVAAAAGAAEVTRFTLPTSYRHGLHLAALRGAVADRVGVVTAGHRHPAPAGPGAAAPIALTCRDATDEAAVVASVLRGWHHDSEDPLSWDRMAVVVRSQSRAHAIRLACRHAGIPVRSQGRARALRDEPAAALVLRASLAAADPDGLDPGTLRALACGPLGDGDPVRWRRLVLALRAAGLDDDGLVAAARSVLRGDAPVPAVGDAFPGLGGVPPPLMRPVARLAAVLVPAARVARAGAAAADVLWAVWSGSGLAERWREQALGSGPRAWAADADLDAVIALFDAASQQAERSGPVPLREFAERVLATTVRDDDLADSGDQGPSVVVTTPAGAAGSEWEGVVVAGVQEGAWPDLRARGSVLRTADLIDVLDGRESPGADQRRATGDDELRLFHVAVSRARRRLVVTAVDGDDQRPSGLWHMVAAASGATPASPRTPLPPWHGHRADGVVAQLRRVVLGVDADGEAAGLPDRAAAARLLARLALAGVGGADPAEWAWVHEATDVGARPVPPDGVRLSPSQVERFHQCPLQWYLQQLAGSGRPQPVRVLGTLVHLAAQRHPRGTADELMAVIESEWHRMGLGTPWVDARERRRARSMVERLATWLAGRPPDHDVLTEVPVDVVVDGVRIRGAVDRLERAPDGSVLVVDFKTGSSPATKAEAADNPQLAVYQLAIEHGGAGGEPLPTSGAVLVQVGGTAKSAGERVQAPLTPESRERARLLVATAADGMGRSTFQARPGSHCDRCAVRGGCPADTRGRRAGPAGGPS